MESPPDDLILFIWRFSNYADLSGRGGLVASGRWHTRGRPVVYCADEPRTALAEALRRVSGAAYAIPETHMMLKVRVPRAIPMERLNAGQLPVDWDGAGPPGWSVCQPFGDGWLEDCATALLQVPSAALRGACNVLINPVHRDADRIVVDEVVRYPRTLDFAV